MSGNMPKQKYTLAVVDVETTGFGKHDRLCEVGIVTLDPETLNTVDEFETLINPKRDIGPVHIHKITASMVADAPTFAEVAHEIANRLNHSVLVAHNLLFDQRMIHQEYDRMSAKFSAGQGICTLSLTGEKLTVAAKRYGIECGTHHKAVDDARVSAQLLKILFEECDDPTEPVKISNLDAPNEVSMLTRDMVAIEETTPDKSLLRQICRYVRYPTTEEKILAYLDVLNSALDDLVITDEEAKNLNDLAKTLELKKEEIAWAHEVYLQTLIVGAKRDLIITSLEHGILNTVARLLHISTENIPSITDDLVVDAYREGTRVCFTGTAVGSDGEEIKRRTLEAESTKRGLQPVAGVSKKSCDLLVASDPMTASGKANNARKFGIPIISAKDFLEKMCL